MLRIKHYTVAVHDLDEAVRNYERRFGMQPIGERGLRTTGNFHFQSMGYGDQIMLRLIHPAADDVPLAGLMRGRATESNPHGEGMYLIAYECDDVDAFCAQVEANGGRVNRVQGGATAWIHPTSSHFVLMELQPKVSDL